MEEKLISERLSNFLLTTAYRDGINRVEVELILDDGPYLICVFPYYSSLAHAIADFVRRRQLVVQNLRYLGRKDRLEDGKTVRRFVFEFLVSP